MLRELVAEAWAQSPRRTLAAIAATPLVVAAAWVVLVVAIVAGSPA
jgi:hypothetical protein